MNKLLSALCLTAVSLPIQGGVFDDPVVVQRIGEHRVVVARGNENSIQIVRTAAGSPFDVEWTAAGPSDPSFAVVSDDGSRVAVVDSVSGEIHLLDPERKQASKAAVTGSPIAAAFHQNDLYLLCRDSAQLIRLGANGARDTRSVPPDSVFMQISGAELFIYSRRDGTVTSFLLPSLQPAHSATLLPFGSDFEIDGDLGYIVVPKQSLVVSFSLQNLQERERFRVGAVPVDLELQRQNAVAGPGVMVVADPSSKAIWRTERSQSLAAAFGRNFLKGLTGLGIGSPRSSTFPTGVDRVWADGGTSLAYDSATGSLYEVSGTPRRIATAIPAGAVTVVAGEIVYWDPAADTLRRTPGKP